MARIAGKRALILVVDDDIAIRTLLELALIGRGHEVETAANGEEALQIVVRKHPQVVLLDLQMPVLDGRGFLRALERRGIVMTLVVMTAAADAQRQAQELGAADCLVKPFDLADVFNLIERLPAARHRNQV